ncbi:rano class II histocompatibility antigen, A beta chain isoform X2 [Denticeps clupeoides]|uniref:rano class II histocompatibility antigen, A beta chain isoform X2 n=1 Tax=Denticeps clupeoides TaxID=299321 RepID=UPI0010A48DE7|nr:rano class II histocompatibility antigen, A beta chain-like isoform X2 [Denticeps clupeoides]
MAALFFWFLAGLETLSSGAEEHTFQQLIGCTFSSAGPVGRFWIYGYNQRDIMHVDLEEEGVAARSDAGSFMVEERRSKLYFKSKEMRLMRICSAVQTVFSLSNSSLSRAVRPTVQVSLAGEEGRRYLACTVRGFYPNVIRVRWVHRGKKVFFGTTTTGLLPQKDGTFQITNYLMLENGTAESFFCETEHVSIEGKLKLRLENISSGFGLTMLPIVLGVLSAAIPLGITSLFIRSHRKRAAASVRVSLNSSDPSETLMELQRAG